jgi:hypothetical protein
LTGGWGASARGGMHGFHGSKCSIS